MAFDCRPATVGTFGHSCLRSAGVPAVARGALWQSGCLVSLSEPIADDMALFGHGRATRTCVVSKRRDAPTARASVATGARSKKAAWRERDELPPDLRRLGRRNRRLREVLTRLLLAAPEGKRPLDCACGIGTQAIGLATLGFVVEGSDPSAASIDRARRE